jgi:excinuclease ABC subunit B
MFKLQSPFKPAGDQPGVISRLVAGLKNGLSDQTLIGVTGSGKTFTMANVIKDAGRPTLVISHNKTLAAQLYQEFKEFFPKSAVHYFVSYYDYYQPEAYIPQSDTYIEKDAAVNEELDRLRHAATQDLLERSDVIIVASVSCIYNIGSPEEYQELSLKLLKNQSLERRAFLSQLTQLQYTRNEIEASPGTFRAKGNFVEIYPATGDKIFKIEIEKNLIKSVQKSADILNPKFQIQDSINIYPAKYWVSPQDKIKLAAENIKEELKERLAFFKKEGKILEAERLKNRTLNDLEMMIETGYCHGVENYSAHLEFRKAGSAPFTLLDYFRYATARQAHRPEQSRGKGDDFLVFIDESHMSIPQLRGMYNGDRSRKQTLIDYGFRLPSALDNRPLKFDEITKRLSQTIYVSATPAPYELEKSKQLVEQFVRPTGLLDPSVQVRPVKNQIPDLISDIQKTVAEKERILRTVLTKRLAEDLAEYLANENIKVHYMHSEIHTLDRPEILKDLREGKYDVLVGINLLREGLDLPEVSLVVILDADKEGFLRNDTTLIQTMGRASRHLKGNIIMYADSITGSMKRAISEVGRRRKIQEIYNKKHGITPQPIKKPIRAPIISRKEKRDKESILDLPPALALQTKGGKKLISRLEKAMREAAGAWEFERAAQLRDYIKRLKEAAR